ncbi:RluA family pseudouridine synthase [Moraxella nasovis]|uniref:RluA family pseudouridine synthase n=1 Tax=Moraxella nasovis TaxID=2904121 RepID=UPI001F604B52|nr:RluA family pseudouridine synthase [Moraxella nasovis]UNU72778.1 RluA family pseudouridine synthase [Moraxella nasovis]
MQKNRPNQPIKSHSPKVKSPKAKSSKPRSPKPHSPKPNSPKSLSADDVITDFAKVNFITVTINQDGQRIDNFLLARLKGLPRSHLYKMIRDDEIRINKKRCKPHTRVYTGDVVRVAPVRLSAKDAPIISDDFAKGLLERIIHEDDGLIVLDKPHGLAVHGGSGESCGVIEAMRVAMGKKYLELVHRIDKDTSGLLLIAKKRSVLKNLQEQFREKTIQKTYLCLVDGHVNSDMQTIDKPLLRYTLASGERRVRVSAEGKQSQTAIKVLARFTLDGKPVSLVQASPKTGRTHQIRVHLASIGHALLGDDKYHRGTSFFSVKHLCLHAWRLSLAGDGEHHKFCSQIPSTWAALLPSDVSHQL